MQVSVLLLTLNEAENLQRCLPSLAFSDDIVVVDSGSTDGTREVAESFGARVLERPFDNFAGQRNYGLDALEYKNKWILHLDADEVATDEFIAELKSIPEDVDKDCFWVPSKLMFLGKWLKRSGMYPTYQVRLAHIDRMRFKQVGHGQREDAPPERIGTLEQPYLHYNFSKGVKDWFQKHARYAHDEAEKLVAEQKSWSDIRQSWAAAADKSSKRRVFKEATNKLPLGLRPLLRFFYMYVFKLGFLDGRAGLSYSVMVSIYEYMIATTAKELRTPKELR